MRHHGQEPILGRTGASGFVESLLLVAGGSAQRHFARVGQS
jgi:hypothetical protein